MARGRVGTEQRGGRKEEGMEARRKNPLLYFVMYKFEGPSNIDIFSIEFPTPLQQMLKERAGEKTTCDNNCIYFINLQLKK